MDHWARTGIRNKPFPAGFYGEVDGLFRTKINTDTATLTFNGVDFKRFANGIPSAQISAKAALGAFIRINAGRMAGHEIMPLLNSRRRD
jgi:hypothetical protein